MLAYTQTAYLMFQPLDSVPSLCLHRLILTFPFVCFTKETNFCFLRYVLFA
jgi:hypothetical protein